MPRIPYTADGARAMIFVDGENLAIRYGSMLKRGRQPRPLSNFVHVDNVCVWAEHLGHADGLSTPAIMRTYYYTAVQGDSPAIADVEHKLKQAGIDSPRVFKKRGGKSKRVDITLATDMLLHATRKHYDVAVLVAGDEDYIPLVDAVQREGARVGIWFVPDGLSPALKMAADFYADLSDSLFNPT